MMMMMMVVVVVDVVVMMVMMMVHKCINQPIKYRVLWAPVPSSQ